MLFYHELEAARTSNAALSRDYAETLERAGETCLLNRSNGVTEARQFFEQSLTIWKEMRDRGTLSDFDAKKPEQVRDEIAQSGITPK